MTWTCSVFYQGARLDDVPCSVEVSSSIEVTPGQASYSPRTFQVLVHETFTTTNANDMDPSTIAIVLKYGGRVVATGSPAWFEQDPPTSALLFALEDRPAEDGDLVPDGREPLARYLDQAATQAAIDAAEAAFNRQGAADSVEIWGTGGGKKRPLPVASIEAVWAPVYNTRSAGRPYPLIFGKPGRDGTPAFKAIPVDDTSRWILIAGHECSTGTVTVFRYLPDGTVYSASYTTQNAQDLLGRRICVVQLPSVGHTLYDPESEYFVAFDGNATGLPSNPCDIIMYLASRVPGIRIDVGSVESLRARLSTYVLDTAIWNAPESAWRLLTETVLPILPVQIVPTAYGIGLAWVSWDDRAVPVSDVSEGVSVFRLSPVRMTRRSAQYVTVQYSLDATSNAYQKLATADRATHSGAGPSATAGDKRIDTPWVYDAATAQRIARDIAAWSPRMNPISYSVDPETHGVEGRLPISVGDTITVNDRLIGFSSQRCVVVTEDRQDKALTLGIQPLT